MTHTNHRQGTRESLSQDYVVFIYAARGINDHEAGPKLQQFLRMGYRYHPVNAGPARTGDRFMVDPEKVVARVARAGSAYLVFDDQEKVAALVKDLVRADLGLSIIISGLFSEVKRICQQARIRPHTAQCSLGVWGNTKKLPEEGILDITTMCGHGMISASFAAKMVQRVREGRLDPEQASRYMAKFCVCGVFNLSRATRILEEARLSN